MQLWVHSAVTRPLWAELTALTVCFCQRWGWNSAIGVERSPTCGRNPSTCFGLPMPRISRLEVRNHNTSLPSPPPPVVVVVVVAVVVLAKSLLDSSCVELPSVEPPAARLTDFSRHAVWHCLFVWDLLYFCLSEIHCICCNSLKANLLAATLAVTICNSCYHFYLYLFAVTPSERIYLL